MNIDWLASRGSLTLAACLAGIIGVAVLLPADLMDAWLKPLNLLLDRYLPWIELSAGKFGHVLAFFFLTLAAVMCSVRLRIGLHIPLILIFALAVLSELSQAFVDGRTNQVNDFLLDIWGVSMGLATHACVRLAHRGRFALARLAGR